MMMMMMMMMMNKMAWHVENNLLSISPLQKVFQNILSWTNWRPLGYLLCFTDSDFGQNVEPNPSPPKKKKKKRKRPLKEVTGMKLTSF